MAISSLDQTLVTVILFIFTLTITFPTKNLYLFSMIILLQLCKYIYRKPEITPGVYTILLLIRRTVQYFWKLLKYEKLFYLFSAISGKIVPYATRNKNRDSPEILHKSFKFVSLFTERSNINPTIKKTNGYIIFANSIWKVWRFQLVVMIATILKTLNSLPNCAHSQLLAIK